MYIGVLLVVVLVLVYVDKLYAEEKFLEGFWTATEAFRAESGVTSLLLYVGPAEWGLSGLSRVCYIVATDDVANTDFKISYWPARARRVFHCRSDLDIWPADLQWRLDSAAGTLNIYGDGVLYACLLYTSPSPRDH
jgi:hypothetical protein